MLFIGIVIGLIIGIIFMCLISAGSYNKGWGDSIIYYTQLTDIKSQK